MTVGENGYIILQEDAPVDWEPANKHLKDKWTSLDGAGKGESSILIISISRDVAVANNYANSVLLLEFDIHYRQDKLGTDTYID